MCDRAGFTDSRPTCLCMSSEQTVMAVLMGLVSMVWVACERRTERSPRRCRSTSWRERERERKQCEAIRNLCVPPPSHAVVETKGQFRRLPPVSSQPILICDLVCTLCRLISLLLCPPSPCFPAAPSSAHISFSFFSFSFQRLLPGSTIGTGCMCVCKRGGRV